MVHYTIQDSNPDNVFDVNMTSGEIFAALPVDYETTPFHWILIKASDSGENNQQGTNINVTVSVY